MAAKPIKSLELHYTMIQVLVIKSRPPYQLFFAIRYMQGGLAAAFDLAAFRKVMIAPVKKSVNQSKTVTSMREMRRIHAILSVATRRRKTHSY